MSKTDPRKLADVLKKIPLFYGLAPTHLRLILGHCVARTCMPGEHLTERGGESQEMYILISGKLAILEEELRVAIIDPVTLVGELGVITGQPRSATLAALESTQVLVIDKSRFDLILRKEPEIKGRIFENIIGMLAEKLVNDNVRVRDFLASKTRYEHKAEKYHRQLDAAVELMVEQGMDDAEARRQIENRADRSTPMVLVVDDEPVARRLLSRGLSRYRTVEAGDGEAALAVLETATAALVLADIQMPNMDGLELLKRLRSERPGLPVVAVSAFVDTPEVTSAGFDAVVRKPVSLEDIRKVVDDLLGEDDDD